MFLARLYSVLLAGIALLWPLGGFADHLMDDRDLGQGRVLYVENCATCHGINLEGQPDWQSRLPDGTLPAPPHDVTGHTWHHDDQLLFDYTWKGGALALAERGVTGFQSAMPGFSDSLTKEEVWTILAYIRSTWPPEAQAVQAARTPPHS